MEHRDRPSKRAGLRLVEPAPADFWETDPAREGDDLDALTELFIGDAPPRPVPVDGDAAATRRSAAGAPEPGRDADEDRVPERAFLESIITGHLPVRGAVWVRGYAARVARAEGRPVVLVRVAPDRTSVEVVGSSAHADPVADIATAVRAAGGIAEHWLLHFDELDQAGLMGSREIDRVTVLSGCDEPAVVSAYRIVKSLHDEGRERGVGVSIVGSSETEAARAIERLNTASAKFMSMDLEARPVVPRLEASAATLIGEVDRRFAPSEIIEMIADRVESASAAEAPTARATPEPEPKTETARRAAPEPAETGATSAPTAAAGRLAEAKPVPTSRPAARPSPVELIDGLRPLGLACPVAPAVTLACDGRGAMHLVAWGGAAASGHTTAGDALLAAAAWARTNRELLTRACPELDGERGDPVRHLVCDDFNAAADLRGADAALRVHFAQPARGVADAWACVPVA